MWADFDRRHPVPSSRGWSLVVAGAASGTLAGTGSSARRCWAREIGVCWGRSEASPWATAVLWRAGGRRDGLRLFWRHGGGSPLSRTWRAPSSPLNDSRVLLLHFCLSELTRLDARFGCGVKVSNYLLTETNAEYWPVAGPRTLSWCARFLNRRSGGPLGRHQFWRSTLKLEKQDWGVESRELGLRQLERARGYDGHDICNWGLPAEPSGEQGEEQKAASIPLRRLHSSPERTGVGRPHGMLGPLGLREVENDASIIAQSRKDRKERNLVEKNKKGDS